MTNPKNFRPSAAKATAAVSTLAGALLLLLVAACATSPTGRSQLILFPEAQLAEMGLTAYEQIKEQTPVENDPQVVRYVACVSNSVTAALPPQASGGWEVTVFEDEQVNAFALPGKKIGVYEGMLEVADSQSQLAAVIAHEVAHVLAQHGNERVSTSFATQTGLQLVAIAAGEPTQTKRTLFGLLGLGAQVGVLLPFSRAQETEADVVGLDLMARAGFDPREAVTLWENMQARGKDRPPEFLSTHPSEQRRIEDLTARMPQATALYEQALAAGRRPDCTRP